MRLFSFNLEVICTRVFFTKLKLHEKSLEGDKNFSVDDFVFLLVQFVCTYYYYFIFFGDFFSIFFSMWKL